MKLETKYSIGDLVYYPVTRVEFKDGDFVDELVFTTTPARITEIKITANGIFYKVNGRWHETVSKLNSSDK